MAEKTGKSLEEWIDVIRGANQTKPTAIVNWLKESHGLNHMQATFLSGNFLNDGQPVFDYEALFSKLFAGKESLIPTYTALIERITQRLPGVRPLRRRPISQLKVERSSPAPPSRRRQSVLGLTLGISPS